MRARAAWVTAIAMVAALAVSSPGSASAQPGFSLHTVPSPNQGVGDNDLAGVAALSNSDAWAAGTYTNSRRLPRGLVEHWDGLSWTIQPSPRVGDDGDQLFDVAAVSSVVGWAVGQSTFAGKTRALIERWNGQAWTVQSLGDRGSRTAGLTSVDADSWHDAWAAGWQVPRKNERPFVLHWNGFNWHLIHMPVPTLGRVDDLTVLSPTDVWALVTDQTRRALPTLIEHWNGSGWKVFRPDRMNKYQSLASIDAIGPDDVWAVGFRIAMGGTSNTLTEHWDGTAWTAVKSPNADGDNLLLDLAAVSDSEVWAVGVSDSSPTGGAALAERWDGSAWEMVQTPNPGSTSELRGVAVAPGDFLWAVGDSTSSGTDRTLVEANCPACV